MGSSGHSTPSRERRGVEHITRYSPGNSQNGEFSQELCMVAKNGHEFRREGVKSCATCQSHQKTPPCSALHPWEWPGRPWSQVHVDYARPFMGKMFLLIIDAHSKWMDIHSVNSATSSVTIDKMRSTFASHGLPEIVVSYNDPILWAVNLNGIKHITSATYHPSTNGLVERAVQTFKQRMTKQGDGSVNTKLARFLLSYRITPQRTTDESPA